MLTRIFCVVFAVFLMPGIIHICNGRLRAGLIWFFASYILIIATCVLIGLPGKFFFVTGCLCAILFVVYLFALAISSWRNAPKLRLRFWFLAIFCVCVFNFSTHDFTKHFKITLAFCEGSSMSPTLLNTSSTEHAVQQSDVLVVNRIIYKWTLPQRGDVVFVSTENINASQELPELIVKRIVGLPGDTIDIDSPYVLVNGKRLREPRIFKTISAKRDGYPGYLNLNGTVYEFREFPLPITLEENEYYLLGDNSPASLDSRFFGPITKDDINGRVIRIVFPFSRMKDVE